MAQQTINNSEAGLAVRQKINSMFTELYGSFPPVPIFLRNKTGSFTLVIPANTWV
jgi:hypothetical protein